MNRVRREGIRYTRIFAIPVALLLGWSLPAYAADPPVQVTAENGTAVNGKAVALKPHTVAAAKGVYTAIFDFHPAQTIDIPLTKNLKTFVINPNPVTLNYSLEEKHGTTGKAVFDSTITQIQVANQANALLLNTTVTPTIAPGNNNNMQVAIHAFAKDPLTFSTSDPSATFDFASDGIDTAFSLKAGTAFPSGPLAAMTSMTFQDRVSPGVVSDPDAFFSSGLTGAIDLYTVTLTSDANGNISSALSFGASSSDFTLDFRDAAGNIFDPTSPADLAHLNAIITGAFSNGTLSSDLDLFTVGFVPRTTGANPISEFSTGGATTVNLGALETATPEPSSWVCLAGCLSGGAFCLRRRQRRKTA